MRQIKVLLLWTLLSTISLVDSRSLGKDGCGKVSSCYSIPASCASSEDCEYLLKYSVIGQDVVFELSSNKYQWIAVGFNHRADMAGGESLTCETRKSDVELNHYNMPKSSRPFPSNNANATLLIGKVFESGLYCKFQRKLDLEVLGRYNLSNSVYILYAAGHMEKSGDEIDFHKIYEHSHKLLSVSDTSSDNTDNSKAKKRIDTSSCGKTLGCSRIPSGCHDNTDCDFLLVLNKTENNVEFSVSGKADGWIAVGFNNKPKMEDTDTVICQTRGGNVSLWVANLEYKSPDLNIPSETSLLESKYEGGIIYCKFTRPLKIKHSKRLSIDVSRYIIYARGSGTTTMNEHEDENKGCSEVKVDFGKNIIYELGECDRGRLARVHGSLMIFAWMFLAVISIFIARYSRLLWKGWKIRGNDAWFQLHRMIMGLAVLFMIIAIIIIFVSREGWSESAGAHAVLGIIVLVLAIIQPTIAFFRPPLNNTRRPIFNWFHRIVAFILVIITVITVFKGTQLLDDYGGDTSYKLLIVLIVIAIVTAMVLEYLAFRLRRKAKEGIPSGFMQEETSELLEVKVQRVLLVAFSFVVFILTVVMIALVAGAGNDDDDDDDD